MLVSMHLRRFMSNFSTLEEAGQVPLQTFPEVTLTLQKIEVTLTAVGEYWLVGQ